MAKKLNSAGASRAASLIRSKKITDSDSEWSGPSTDSENSYIEKHGMADWSRWYLGVDTSEDSENKGRYSYPFSDDFKTVNMKGLRAIISRSAQGDHKDIQKKASDLLEQAKKKLGKAKDKESTESRKLADALPAANSADDCVAFACYQALGKVRLALAQCDECTGHPEAVQTCRECIADLAINLEDLKYSSDASAAARVKTAIACAEACEACIVTLEEVAKVCGDCDEACELAIDFLENACLACREHAGDDAGGDDAGGDGNDEGNNVTGVVSLSKKKVTLKNPDWLKVVAKADGHHMHITGFIGADVTDDSGTADTQFLDELKRIPDGKHIHVHVDSEGGSLPAGMAIYNALKARRPNVTSYVDGVALSCGSLVALAGDKVYSPLSSVWMIHKARIATYGDDEEHKKAVKMLKAFSDMMADVYAAETGHTKDEIVKMMDAGESWFTGAEAVDFGLADALEPSEEDQTEDDTDGPVAFSRYESVFAMYQPPENVRQLISAARRGGATTQTHMSGNATPAAAPAAATNPLEQRFMQERTARITGEVNRRAQGRVKNENLQWWLDLALATLTSDDEKKVYAQLEALPVAAAPGHAPLPGDAPVDGNGQPIAQAQGQPVAIRTGPVAARDLRWGDDAPRPRTAFGENLRRLPFAQRVAVHRREWNGHFRHCIDTDIRGGVDPKLPVAANTFSATLITDFLVDVAITVLQNRWASLECFTRDFSTDRYKPLATGQVKLVAAGATTLVGTKGSPITSFESGDSTVRNVPVVMNHYSQPFHVTQDELMSGLRLENLTVINLAVLSDTITTNALNNLITGGTNTAGNLVAYSGTVCSQAGTFNWLPAYGMPALWARIKKSPLKNVILDGKYLANIINQPGFFQPTFEGERDSGRARTFGWDAIEEHTNWPALSVNGNALGGFACNPTAILVCAGLPQVPPTIPGATLTETVITIPGPDISIASYMWFSLASRTLWNSFDVVFGSGGGDATAGCLLFDGSGPVSAA